MYYVYIYIYIICIYIYIYIQIATRSADGICVATTAATVNVEDLSRFCEALQSEVEVLNNTSFGPWVCASFCERPRVLWGYL